MELEVGMYVRGLYNIGKIHQITEIEGRKICDCENATFVFQENIKKASHNIIDLIEVGDYVNGYQVTGYFTHKDKYLILKIEQCLVSIDDNIANEEIKEVLTKQQYEANVYKIKE